MVGVRKLKHCSFILFLLGVGVITLTYKWFFEQHLEHRPRLPMDQFRQLEPLQALGFPPPEDHRLRDDAKHVVRHAKAPGPLNQHDQNQNYDISQNAAENKNPEEAAAAAQPDPESDRDSGTGNDPADSKPKPEVAPGSAAAEEEEDDDGKGADADTAAADSDNNKNNKNRNPPSANDKQSAWEKEVAKRIVSNRDKDHNKVPTNRRLIVLHEEEQNDASNVKRSSNGVTSKLDIRRLHRSFSNGALRSGNVYTTSETDPTSEHYHVVVFVARDAFTAAMTLVNSVVKNSKSPNVTFHFVASKEDKRLLKQELDSTPLKDLTFEVIEYPQEWSQGKNTMEFASFRLGDLLPYMGGRVTVLDPWCLVKGDIADLAGTTIPKGHYAAMATLCNPGSSPSSSSSSSLPEERYRHHLNFSHEEIAKLHVQPDTCVPSPAVMVVPDLYVIRVARTRQKMWHWMHLNDRTPVFLKTEGGAVSSKAPYSVVFHNHTTLLSSRWYTRVSAKSGTPGGSGGLLLYHWVGEGKPWDPSSPVASLWNPYLITPHTDSG
ncbi:glycosyltransferase 8 domain-containing protein 2-like isoform X2 [Babylonia areolata]|uniref:glycosyltransferase 8 domain-containing protein 2-like isoform X2 n=1 Tax=Babylonia areolata TaxID=304850 RepID=UPI003FD1370E